MLLKKLKEITINEITETNPNLTLEEVNLIKLALKLYSKNICEEFKEDCKPD